MGRGYIGESRWDEQRADQASEAHIGLQDKGLPTSESRQRGRGLLSRQRGQGGQDGSIDPKARPRGREGHPDAPASQPPGPSRPGVDARQESTHPRSDESRSGRPANSPAAPTPERDPPSADRGHPALGRFAGRRPPADSTGSPADQPPPGDPGDAGSPPPSSGRGDFDPARICPRKD